jgi:uncharacterized protein
LRFWDSSAIIPLTAAEASTEAMQAIAEEDPIMYVWWGTEIECVSALAMLEREGALTDRATTAAVERLDLLAEAWNAVTALRGVARRLLRVHTLRAADALQLAAAAVASEGLPSSLDIVTLDERLAIAARREGFTVHEHIQPAS